MVSIQITESSDDGRADDGLYGHIYSTIAVGWNNTYGMNSWVRFPGVNIPRKSIISVAYLRVRVQSKVGNGASLEIFAEDAESPTYPTSLVDYNARVPTTNYVSWSISESSGYVNSPSLVSVVQEIIDKYTCGSMQFLLKGTGAGVNFTGLRAVDNYPADSATLFVEYTPAPAGGAGRLIGGKSHLIGGPSPLIGGPSPLIG